jgi:hypothetical protein
VTELQAIARMSHGRVHELHEPGLNLANEDHDEATLFDLQQRMAQVAQHVAALNPSLSSRTDSSSSPST